MFIDRLSLADSVNEILQETRSLPARSSFIEKTVIKCFNGRQYYIRIDGDIYIYIQVYYPGETSNH